MEDIERGIAIFAQVGIDLGTKLDAMKESNDRLWKRLQFGTPVRYRSSVSVVLSNTTSQYVELFKPDQGTYASIESVLIGGTDLNIDPAGSAALYVAGSNTGTSPGTSMAVDWANNIPNAGFYGGRDIIVSDGERLGISIFNGTSGQTYVISFTASIYNQAAALGQEVNVAGL